MKHTKRLVKQIIPTLAATTLIGFVVASSSFAKPPNSPRIELSVLGTHATGIYEQGGAEIAAYDSSSKRLYFVNAQAASVDVLDISNPATPTKVGTIHLLPFGGVANSVAAHEGLVAVAMEATPDRTANGKVVFFDANLTPLNAVTVGAVPDMLTFTHKGRYVLVANEGEPNGYGTGSNDPEGSISIIHMQPGAANLTQANVRTADFTAYNGHENALRAAGVRIFGPGANAAKDLEPEYLTVSPDDTTAWVTLQENNALAIVDIPTATVRSIVALGLKDHNLRGNELDPSDRDNAIRIKNWPIKGMYQPDGIAAYVAGTELFLVMANEGDARDWPGLTEEIDIGNTNYVLDPVIFPNAATLKQNSNLGRLRASRSSGMSGGDYDEIHIFGGRSFSIRNAAGALVYDSGADFEWITAALHPDVIFNASNNNNTFDSRSRAKGPEPEGIAVGRAFQRTWAFIGLERVGGVMVYDVTNPASPKFATYANNRNFTGSFSFATAGDLGPEGVLFIEEGESPTGQPLLVLANEISGSVTIFQVNEVEQ